MRPQLSEIHPPRRAAPTKGDGTFPPLMGGIKGGWRIFMPFCEPMVHECLLCKKHLFL